MSHGVSNVYNTVQNSVQSGAIAGIKGMTLALPALGNAIGYMGKAITKGIVGLGILIGLLYLLFNAQRMLQKPEKSSLVELQ